MKNFQFSSVLILLALSLSIFSCTKKEDPVPVTPTVDVFPSIPDAARFNIHFGTATQMGCMYSFSNCIWIGWGADAINSDARLAVQFSEGNEAGQYFGNYYPLTADFTLDAATAEPMGLKAQVIPAGLYPLSDSPVGKMVIFDPASAYKVASLVNENNPQDNIGQLHNLALQVILNAENKAAIRELNGDKTAIRQFIEQKTFQFLEESGLPVSKADQERIKVLELRRDYSNYAARLNETRLSANDKKVLLPILDEAYSMPVTSPEQLSRFVTVMTELENNVANNQHLDDPRMVLSTLSVLKYSRYYWYWKSITKPGAGSGTPEPQQIPDWVWADMIGLELGGPAGSIIASAIVYADTH